VGQSAAVPAQGGGQGRAGTVRSRAACQARFANALDAIRADATVAAIPCRYRDNGDNTVTDFDTGLMWAKQNALDGFTNLLDVLDADNTFTLDDAAAAAATLTGTTAPRSPRCPGSARTPTGACRRPSSC
jgi:hypothetical protein